MFNLHASVRASIRPSVLRKSVPLRLYVSAISPVQYHVLANFRQTFVAGEPWDKDELIRFSGQRSRSRSHFRDGGVPHSTLSSSEAYYF